MDKPNKLNKNQIEGIILAISWVLFLILWGYKFFINKNPNKLYWIGLVLIFILLSIWTQKNLRECKAIKEKEKRFK